MRTGLGYDLHQLVENRKLILGGIEVPYHLGLKGHSDADVVIHALIDALLGAAGFDDIGTHFPDNDPNFKDIDSMILLNKTMLLISEKGFAPTNADITIIAEQPKLKDYKPLIKHNLAEALSLPPEAVAVKAKTNETMDSVGQSKAIVALAAVGLACTDE
ncbi:MAG: 2-C-methyl-D-erythritol 2,4-cyclodiphosphate synthase [Phycisphaerae bacterium]|nr:2-C-methyl-D-erythritol 2,4-cyclodiphosphate synthase [Phycisphaerae bacterium]